MASFSQFVINVLKKLQLPDIAKTGLCLQQAPNCVKLLKYFLYFFHVNGRKRHLT